MKLDFEKQEILSLFLYLSNHCDSQDPSLQGAVRKLEEFMDSNCTISEIAILIEKNEGEP